ncbi:MAG: carboxylesterase family protein [Bacteroidia bacterium]|nr:carboxylesterase family protein [Bacteroidia bacterium]
MKSIFFLPLLLFTILFSSVSSQTVTTQFGPVQGSINGSVIQFLGIPFAKPPVGSLRWKAPQNPDSWSSALITNSFAPVCPQKKFTQGSSSYTLTGNEDCLYLNIWTPQTGAGTRPVLVFIHGGGNQQGGASEDGGGTQMFFGKNMAQRGNAVVVTIQYRLGPLGFLVHPGLEQENTNNVSGNYAVMDQVLALTWIKNNIANFGGDPNKIMIFGESAGGVNVGNLLLTPLAAGLFERACIQSATPVIGDYNTIKNKGISFVDSFTTAGTDVQKIAFMRTLPSDSVIKNEVSPLIGGAVGMNWQVVKDNVTFTDFPTQLIQSGNFNKVPLMLGSNADEMSLSAPPTVVPAMVTALINASVPSSLQTQATTLYPPGSNTTQARQSYIGILTDAQFTATSRRTAQCVSLNQTQPVWRYFFSHKHTFAPLTPLGSYHGMELFYVFNNWENATAGSGPLFKPQDDSVQKAMLGYWVNFANTGDPNGVGLVTWPQYTASVDPYIEIKASPNGSQAGLRTPQTDLWDNSIGFVPCVSTLGFNELKNGERSFVIYPNPNSGSFNLVLEKELKNGEVRIYNTLGQKVHEQYLIFGKNKINTNNLFKGIYNCVLMENNKLLSTSKLIIE